MRSSWTDIDGPVHYLDFGGPPAAPVMVCVHGLAGSAENWSALAPLLTRRYRVIAPDLAGHGLTRSMGRGTTVQANRTLLHRFVQQVADGPVILMGNSMGGMIALLEAGAAADLVSGLVLVDPALPFGPARPDPMVAALFTLYATPGIGRLLTAVRRHVPPETAVSGVLQMCCADSSRVPREVVARHVELARMRAAFPEVGHDFAGAIRSVIGTAGSPRGPVYRKSIRAVCCPVLLLHGSADRLVPVTAAAAAARAHPDWTVVILSGVGHVPQLEAPDRCAAEIFRWADTAGPRPPRSRRNARTGSAAGHTQ